MGNANSRKTKKSLPMIMPVTRRGAGALAPLKKIFPPCKNGLDIVKKNWAPLSKLFASPGFSIWLGRGNYAQGRNDGEEGGIIPRAPYHCGGRQMSAGSRKRPNNFTSTFFNTVYFLPKDLRCEHGGAKLASCPGRRLSSLRP